MMIAIDEGYIDTVAPNAEAAKNGRALVLKGKFLSLQQSVDQTLLFGECQGSGSKPYQCSCDFQRPEAATHRCSCPSRQFPCKHCLGLMYAFVQGKPFTPTEVPADLQAKREKMQARTEQKTEQAEKPRKVDKNALAKKIHAQLVGIDLLEKLTCDLVRLGMGNMNAKTSREVEEQARQLGNAYLTGAQSALHQLTTLFSHDDDRIDTKRSESHRESVYSEALDQLSRLHNLVKQGRAYLQRRLDDPELAPETDSSIAAWLGHAWQLRELKDAGLVEIDAELAQLAFNSCDDVSRREFVDTGIWMNLADGRIRLTQNFRPYRAAKHLKSDDSFFQVAQVQELYTYPGNVNPRIRWDAMTSRPLQSNDLQKIRNHGHGDFSAVVKEVKNHLKGPLSDKQPIYALNFQQLGKVVDSLVIEDKKGDRLVLTDTGMTDEPPSCHLLRLLPPECLANQTVVVRFRHDLDTRQLQVKPLSIVTATGVIRLTL